MNQRWHLATILVLLAAEVASAQAPGAGGAKPSAAALLSIEARPAVEFPIETGPRPLFSLGFAGQLTGTIPLPFLSALSPALGVSYTYLPVRAETSLSVAGFGLGGRVGVELGRRFVVSATALGGGYVATFNDTRVDAAGAELANQSGAAGYMAAGAEASFYVTPWASLSVAASYHNYLGLYQSVRAGLGITVHVDGFQRKVSTGGLGLEPVFPVLLGYYGEHSLGRVTVRNDERFPVSNMEVTLFVPGAMEKPRRAMGAGALQPGQSATLELYGLFKESVLSLKEDTQLTAELAVRYTLNGRRRELVVPSRILVHHRNAMVWDDDRKAAAFVAAKDPEVLRYAKAVAGIVRSAGPAAVSLDMRMGIGMLASLGSYGMSYVVDPNTPSYADASRSAAIVDFLQFPKQTLDYRGGDCDDLAILYCALLEAVGVHTAFITVPGHIYAAFSTGMSAEEAFATFSDRASIVVQDGTAWVPVETTMVGKSFQDAWRNGAEQWTANAGSGAARLYPTDASWQLYPAAAWPAEGEPVRVPPDETLTAGYRKEIAAFAEAELYPQVEKLRLQIERSNDPTRLQNRLGVLYARYGLTDRAKGIFEEILKRMDYPPAAANLGSVLYLSGDLQGALSLFERALASNPRDGTMLLNVARVSYDLEQFAKAKSYYGELARNNPGLSKEYAYLGSADTRGSRAEDVEALALRMLWKEEGE